MKYVNPLIATWKAGPATMGDVAQMTPDPSIAEYFALAGFDESDGRPVQHRSRPTTPPGIFQAIEAAVQKPRRVPFNYVATGKSARLGAQMVIIPMVNNAEEARRAPRVAAFLRHPPRGNRSRRSGAAAAHHGRLAEELEGAACVLMIETKDGLANLDEIAATPGVDAIYIGPGDLALGLGLGWDSDSRSKSKENGTHTRKRSKGSARRV